MSLSQSTPLRLLGYARCSDEKQDQSIGQQVEWISGYVERGGHTLLAPVFTDEGIPGRFLSRPGFDRMLALCREMYEKGDPPDGVVIWHSNRFSRASGWATGTVWEDIRLQGVRFLITSARTYDLNNKTDQLILTVEQHGESSYSPTLAQNVTRGLMSKARGGQHVASPPFGYTTRYRQGDKPGRQVPEGWDIVPEEAALVRRLFRAYATGTRSLRSLAEELNKESAPTPSVLRNRKGATAQWSMSSVRNVLSNEAYLGVHTWNRRRSGAFFCAVDGVPAERPEKEKGKLKHNDRKQWARREGAHEALVDEAMFEKVRGLLTMNKQRPASCRGRMVYLFTGLVRCGQCGGSMIGKARSPRHTSRINTYRCFVANQKGPSGCNGCTLNEARLLAALAGKIKERFTPELLDAYEEAVRRVLAGAGPDIEAERARLTGRLAELDAKLAEHGTRYLNAPAFMLPQIEAAAKEAHDERDRTAKALAGLADKAGEVDVSATIAAARAALGELEAVLAGSDRAATRALLREHVERIEVHFGEKNEDRSTAFARALVYLRESSPLRCLADPAELCRRVNGLAQFGQPHFVLTREDYLRK